MRLFARRALSSAPRRVPTLPHATVTVRGGAHGGNVAFSTNMESDTAMVSATDLAGHALDAATAFSVEHAKDSASFEVLERVAGMSLDIAVPASFSIVAQRIGQPSNVSVTGWIEGGVALTAERGSLSVRTVRGMLTTLETGEGDISAEMIEGDARMSTSRGAITIGKLQGKVLHAACAHGDLSARAIYCEVAHLVARSGSIRLGFLHTDRAHLEVATGAVHVDALDGSADVRASKGGSIRIQLSDGARELHLHADGDVDVLVPEHLAFSANASGGKAVHCDPSLRPLVLHDKAGGVHTMRLARQSSTNPRAEPKDGLPAGLPTVHASSSCGTVRFLAHSWLDRFKARMPPTDT